MKKKKPPLSSPRRRQSSGLFPKLWSKHGKESKKIQPDSDASVELVVADETSDAANPVSALTLPSSQWKINIFPSRDATDPNSATAATGNGTLANYSPTDRPSIYEESMEMLTGALLIYLFADLREMAREGEIDSSDLLNFPLAINQVVEAIQTHKEALAKRAINHKDMEEKLQALKDIRKQQIASSSLMGYVMRDKMKSKENNSEGYLANFHDEKSTQGMVYGIAVNHLRRRVTVIFRGSVTQQDFMTDAQTAQKKLTISLAPDEEPSVISVHTGFYKYMFQADDDGKVRRDHILSDAKNLLKENPGYCLYCTGHSLGGALCTLFGFFAAADDEVVENGPVVVVSIASPRVGGANFCEAFQVLEKRKRLQHLRISNKEDMISHVPYVHFKATAFSPLLAATLGAGNIYNHCGIHLQLTSILENDDLQCPFTLTYPKNKNDEEGITYTEELKRGINTAMELLGSLAPVAKADFQKLIFFHSCDEYEARLETCKKFLSSKTLDQLYGDESFVGRSISRGLKSD
jgi:hypothetical protein